MTPAEVAERAGVHEPVGLRWALCQAVARTWAGEALLWVAGTTAERFSAERMAWTIARRSCDGASRTAEPRSRISVGQGGLSFVALHQLALERARGLVLLPGPGVDLRAVRNALMRSGRRRRQRRAPARQDD